MITRRRWLQLLGSSGFSSVLAPARLSASAFFTALFDGGAKSFAATRMLRTLEEPASLPAFEEIPSSKSGITWKHVAGISPEMYMPETVGSGCAFLDYDNDGWMDIYLVNS